jgi:hypothetical protein
MATSSRRYDEDLDVAFEQAREDRIRENVRGGGLGAADYVGVDPERDGRVRVAETGRDDVDRDAGE